MGAGRRKFKKLETRVNSRSHEAYGTTPRPNLTMETTIEHILSSTATAEDVETTTVAPCSRCEEPTHHNTAFLKTFGSGCCRCCAWAYMCFLLLHEHRKATYQKREIDSATATTLGKKCSDGFRAKYGRDWREQLRDSKFDLDKRLSTSLSEPILVASLAVEAREKGYL